MLHIISSAQAGKELKQLLLLWPGVGAEMGQSVQTVPLNPTPLQVLPPLLFMGSASQQPPISLPSLVSSKATT